MKSILDLQVDDFSVRIYEERERKVGTVENNNLNGAKCVQINHFSGTLDCPTSCNSMQFLHCKIYRIKQLKFSLCFCFCFSVYFKVLIF